MAAPSACSGCQRDFNKAVPRQSLTLPAGIATVPDVQSWGWREYGVRDGLCRNPRMISLSIHPYITDVLHVIDGAMTVSVAGAEHKLEPSDTCAVPNHEAVLFDNSHSREAVYVFVVDDAPLHRKLGIYEKWPKELSDLMHVKEGDTLHAVVDANGGVRITPFDPHFEDALKAFERTRRKYRNALKELAK